MSIDSDLKAIMSGMDKLTMTNGVAKDRELRGMFDTNHLQKSLNGVELATIRPMFSCPTPDILGIKSGDRAEFNGKLLIVARLKSDAVGLTMIEFEEDLDGEIVHDVLI